MRDRVIALPSAPAKIPVVTGGEMVVQHAVGVNDEANLNAPSSLHRPVHRPEPVIRPR
jgi:hypothetical protein